MTLEKLEIAMQQAFAPEFEPRVPISEKKQKRHKLNRYKRKMMSRRLDEKNFKECNCYYQSVYYKDKYGRIRHEYLNNKYFKRIANKSVRREPIPSYNEVDFIDIERYDYDDGKCILANKSNIYRKVYDYSWYIN